jgi:hypothetical protein
MQTFRFVRVSDWTTFAVRPDTTCDESLLDVINDCIGHACPAEADDLAVTTVLFPQINPRPLQDARLYTCRQLRSLFAPCIGKESVGFRVGGFFKKGGVVRPGSLSRRRSDTLNVVRLEVTFSQQACPE